MRWSLALLPIVIGAPLAANGAAVPANTEFRVELTQKGSTVRVEARDVTNATITFAVPATVEFSADEPILQGDDDKWKTRVLKKTLPGEKMPRVSLKPSLLWPEEVEVRVRVTPDGAKPQLESTDADRQPPQWAALVGALLGALAWMLIDWHRVTKTEGRWIALAGAIVAGFIAFAAPKLEAFWDAIGLKPEAFQPQTYVLLGLATSYIGVGRLLAKVTGRESKPMTSEEVKNEFVKVLDQGDAVRKPVREELGDILFGDNYIRQHPELVTNTLGRVLRLHYADYPPPDLTTYLDPRLTQLCKSSYRETVETFLDVKKSGELLYWAETTSYDFIRNPAERALGPDIRLAHEEEIPPSLRDAGNLTSLGTLVKRLEISVSEERAGEVRYRGETGNRLDLAFHRGVDAPASLEVVLKPTDDGKYIKLELDFTFPEKLRDCNRVRVKTRMEWVSKLEDGVYFSRSARLTHKYRLVYDFGDVFVDKVPYEWRLQWEDYKDGEDEAGIIDLPRWLLPGNGVCLWYSPNRQKV